MMNLLYYLIIIKRFNIKFNYKVHVSQQNMFLDKQQKYYVEVTSLILVPYQANTILQYVYCHNYVML